LHLVSLGGTVKEREKNNHPGSLPSTEGSQLPGQHGSKRGQVGYSKLRQRPRLTNGNTQSRRKRKKSEKDLFRSKIGDKASEIVVERDYHDINKYDESSLFRNK